MLPDTFSSMKMRFLSGAVSVCIWSFGAIHLGGVELNVYAAASLTDALKEIGDSYKIQTGDKISFNFGASNILARQIEEGAPVDIFISADEMRMDILQKQGLLVNGTRKNLLSNALVIVIAVDSPLNIKSPNELKKADIKKIALAEPQSVPAGIYARQYLQKLGLWEQVIGKIIPTENVRASLAAVESGNVDAGIVYKTDALHSKKIKVVYEVPTADGPRISYPVALLKSSRESESSRKFLVHLESKESDTIFKKHGLMVLE